MIVACTSWKQSSKHHESSYGSPLSRRGGCRKVLQNRYSGVTQQFVKCINLCTTLEQRLQTRVPQMGERLLTQVHTLCAQKTAPPNERALHDEYPNPGIEKSRRYSTN